MYIDNITHSKFTKLASLFRYTELKNTDTIVNRKKRKNETGVCLCVVFGDQVNLCLIQTNITVAKNNENHKMWII